MSIQFAGSKSADDRRRRRLVVNADDAGADGTTGAEGLPGSGVSSELVKSAAAAPWVPVSEFRLWTYAVLIGLVISGAAFALATPMSVRPELAPLTKHLLEGDRPALAVLIQTTVCFLCAQLSLLIGWYRAQCKLDFRGLYRVWPWAAAVFGTAAICLATNAHGLAGQIVESTQLLQWRPSVVAWLLPLTLAASPLIVLIDRDVRRSRSSLYTLRMAWILLLASASLELCAVDLAVQPWAAKARIIVPLFAVATLFVGLWLHARVVAYICPDPPEAATTSAVSQLMAVFGWMAARLVWKRAPKVVEAEVKPKRGRKKATTDEEEESATPKRKRKTPAKRVTKPRTRKVAEPEEEEVEEEEQESTYSDESTEAADPSYGYDEETEESNEWEEEEEELTPPPKSANRSKQESSPVPPPYSGAQKFANNSNSAKNTWKEPEPASNDSEDDEESDDSDSESGDSNGGPDPLKGLTKRQKRELRRQNKDQQRNPRR
jgi:hypothetical protein